MDDAQFWIGPELAVLLILLIAVAALIWVRIMPEPHAETREIASRFEDLVDFATDMFWETDVDGVVTMAGGRLMPTVAPDISTVIGQHYLDILRLEAAEMTKMTAALRARRPYSDIQSIFEDSADRKYYISLSATPRYDPAGKIKGYLGVGTNVTDRVRNQKRVRHMAEHDMLTGLANRYAFTTRLTKDLDACTGNEILALLSIDLDGFKTINDTYGHQAGDALLKMVAKRLSTKTRETDWAARLGGDEFVVISQGLANPMDACLVADRLTAALRRPYRIGGVKLSVKASVGVACASKTSNNIEKLMKRADLAMYRAKSEGKGCYRLHEDAGILPAGAI